MSKVAEIGLPPFRLTQRDVAIIQAVYTHRVLTTPQINTLFFETSMGSGTGTVGSRCRHRLKCLYRHGYLHRDHPPVKPAEGRRPFIYMLGKRAVPLLAQVYGLLPEEIDWKPAHKKVSWYFLAHLLATNDARVAIEVAADRRGHNLIEWQDERTLRGKEMKARVTIKTSKGRDLQYTVVPDGYFQLFVSNETDRYEYRHLIEIDMGTESGRRFSRKLKGYLSYWESGQYRDRYGTDILRVLIVTTGEKRMKNLKEIAERVGVMDGVFYFTTFDRISAETVLTAPVWEIAGHEGRFTLIW